MPMHTERRRRGRGHGRYSDLDWFGEDPWAEPDLAALERDADDEWYPGSWESTDEDFLSADDVADSWNEDQYDGWGPIRRRKRPSERP